MSQLLSVVPGLYWVAFVLLGLALWADDLRGVFLAAVCMLIGTLQKYRTEARPRTGGDGRDGGEGGDLRGR